MTRGGLPYGTYSADSTYSTDRTDRIKGIMGLRWAAEGCLLRGSGKALIAKKVVGEVMIIEGEGPPSPYPLPPYITDTGQ